MREFFGKRATLLSIFSSKGGCWLVLWNSVLTGNDACIPHRHAGMSATARALYEDRQVGLCVFFAGGSVKEFLLKRSHRICVAGRMNGWKGLTFLILMQHQLKKKKQLTYVYIYICLRLYIKCLCTRFRFRKNSSNLGATAVINNRNTTNKKTSQRHVQNKTLASVTSSVRCSGSTLPVITHCNL